MEQAVVTEVTFRVGHEDPTAASCTGLDCHLSATLFDPTIVSAIVFVAVAVFAAFAYIRDARASCREEHRRVTDERDAFVEFADRVRDVQPTQAHTAGPLPNGSVHVAQFTDHTGPPSDRAVEQVKDAYRETVMSVPHYGEEYDDTFAESVAAEFGEDVATVLLAGDGLSSALRSTLITRSHEARVRRDDLADAVTEEISALEGAELRLSRIDRERRNLCAHVEEGAASTQFDAAVDVWQRLDDLESECSEIAAERQQTLRDPPLHTVSDRCPSFYEYLYGELEETEYPVLSAIATLADRIREDKQSLSRLLARTA